MFRRRHTHLALHCPLCLESDTGVLALNRKNEVHRKMKHPVLRVWLAQSGLKSFHLFVKQEIFPLMKWPSQHQPAGNLGLAKVAMNGAGQGHEPAKANSTSVKANTIVAGFCRLMLEGIRETRHAVGNAVRGVMAGKLLRGREPGEWQTPALRHRLH